MTSLNYAKESAMADTTTAPTNTLEESLNKTDFGHWMYENRKLFIAAVFVVFVIASGWLFYKQMQKQEAQKNSAEVYAFEMENMEGFRTGKLAIADFLTKFNALSLNAKTSPSMLPIVLEASRFMDEKGESKKAEEMLKVVIEALGVKSPYYVFLAFNYASLLEKNGNAQAALTVYADYVKAGQKLMLAQAYLELGRVHLKLGQMTEAKTHLDFVVANYPNDEATKLAKLYIQKLK
jgi:predicted negative regulator of RcsB-dependent stress response